jgi:hypothetical protein
LAVEDSAARATSNPTPRFTILLDELVTILRDPCPDVPYDGKSQSTNSSDKNSNHYRNEWE